MGCKSFGLNQPIRTCHIIFLLKFIVKLIHPNIPNNISKKKKKKKKTLFHVFPKISVPPQLMRLQPQSSLDLHLPPYYLAGQPIKNQYNSLFTKKKKKKKKKANKKENILLCEV